MFYGNYEHNLDEKNRLMVPKKMRLELSQKAYIMKGFDGALAIYKEESFLKLMEDINSLDFNKKSAREYIRAQLSSVVELEIDKAGRFQLPTQLLDKLHIGKSVVVLGALDHIEVWDKNAYQEYMSHADDNFEAIAEEIK